MSTLLETPFWWIGLSLVAVYLIGGITYRLYFHPLSSFPGPKLAAVTLWYEFYYDVVQPGRYTWKIAELHKQYGPIIRISPHEIHIHDPKFFDHLYRQDGRWNKYGWTYKGFSVPNASICTVDHEVHKRRKRPALAFFSEANVLAKQDILHERVIKLRQRILDIAESGKRFNLGVAVNAMFTDVAAVFLLGWDSGYLDMQDFNESVANLKQGSGRIWRLSKQFPFVGLTLKSMPLSWLEKSGDPDIPAFVDFLRKTEARVEELMARFSEKRIESTTHPTFVDAILDRPDLPPSDKAAQRLKDEVDTTVGAAETPGSTSMRLILYNVYHNPQILARLRDELKGLASGVSAEGRIADITHLEKLEYLTAVIKEGLRLCPGVVTRMARIAPDRDLEYGGRWVIPAGTPVGMTPFLMHIDADQYPQPFCFDPERWLDNSTTQDGSLRIWAPFSRGSRMCTGSSLGWAEMRLVLAMLVSTFDMDLGDTSSEEIDVWTDSFAPGTKSPKGLRAIPSVRSKA